MKEVFYCYKSEGNKILELLNQKKEAGYVVTKLEFVDGIMEGEFEECHQDYIYSIDYSSRYYNSANERDEYFDIAKLNGWKMQYICEGMGIWVNSDVNAAPFWLDEEYLQLEERDYLKRLKFIKFQAIFMSFILLVSLSKLIFNGRVDIVYELPFALIYYYMIYSLVKKKKEYPKMVIDIVYICFLSYVVILKNFYYVYILVIELMLLGVCLYLIKAQPNKFTRRIINFVVIFYVIIFMVNVIYGG